MTRTGRLVTTLSATAALTVGAVAPALAHDCTNASKAPGAGVAASFEVVLFVSSGGELLDVDFSIHDERLTPGGKVAGGFATADYAVSVDGSEPAHVGTWDIFLGNDLPDVARLAGAGDGACDGVGVDDVATCLMQSLFG